MGYIGIMEKNMETTIGYIGITEKKMEITRMGLYRDYIRVYIGGSWFFFAEDLL